MPQSESTGPALLKVMCPFPPKLDTEILLYNLGQWIVGVCRSHGCRIVVHQSGSDWSTEVDPSAKWILIEQYDQTETGRPSRRDRAAA
jgi:hypothetical protein